MIETGIINLEGDSKVALVFNQMNEPRVLVLMFCFAQASEVSTLLGYMGSMVPLPPCKQCQCFAQASRVLVLTFCFAQASEVSALLGCIPSAVGYQPMLSTDMSSMKEHHDHWQDVREFHYLRASSASPRPPRCPLFSTVFPLLSVTNLRSRQTWHSTTTTGKTFKGSITSVQAVHVPANNLTDPAPNPNTTRMTTMTQPVSSSGNNKDRVIASRDEL
ncbi:hypothetical protein EDB85DRAFT_1901798 [Lactarius pseudohatsudake]|nr:hypothetical protein EDB85DRAFT_1901798 [Lactarius pseudohatsudake]